MTMIMAMVFQIALRRGLGFSHWGYSKFFWRIFLMEQLTRNGSISMRFAHKNIFQVSRFSYVLWKMNNPLNPPIMGEGGEVNLPEPPISGCINGNNTKFGREVPLNVQI